MTDPDQPSTPDTNDPHYDRGLTREVERGSLDPTEEGLVGASEAGIAPPPPQRRGLGLTPDGRFRVGRLAGLTMTAAIWTLSWPVMLESFLNSLVGLTDTVLAAGLGVPEADAIAGASYIMWFIGLVIMAVGVGATALISRSVGAGRLAVASAVLGQSLVLSVTLGTVVAVGVASSAKPVTGLLNMTGEAGSAFSTYILVIAAGIPFTAILFTLTACARGAGDSRRPLYAMVIRNIVNMIVSFLLSGVDITHTAAGPDGPIVHTVLANPAHFDLGILGIALGTFAGDTVGAGVMVWMALRGTWGIALYRKRLRPHWITIKRLVNLGVPNFLETAGMWFGNFLVLVMVGGITVTETIGGITEEGGLLGAHMIAVRIEAMSFLLGFAMGAAAATLAGQYLGAGRADLARKAVWRCAAVAAAVMGSFGLAFLLIPRTLVGLLSSQPEHLAITPTLLTVCGWVQIPFAIGIVLRSALRGAGDVKVVMAITWISTYLVRLPLAFLLCGADLVLGAGSGHPWLTIPNPMPDDFPIHGIRGLWIGLCIDLVIRGVIFTFRFTRRGWTGLRV
ncbi:MAG: MATE family efflux transporter [Phycisphaeraceae bacterium]|nr:MAG: MATE family efflux transporter [Phycisphaeraceae bacterium]